MPAVCFYFQIHQPRRIKRYSIFNVGRDHEYFNDTSETNLNNARIIHKVAEKSYRPATIILRELLQRYPQFKVSFSFSGVILEQLEKDSLDTLRLFQEVVRAGAPRRRGDLPRVEVLSETYHHSLAFIYSPDEFQRQVALHRAKIGKLFGQKSQTFRNTELIFNNDLARTVAGMGYRGILAEGADHILGWRSPNFLYMPAGIPDLKVLLKNYRLSDDIAFRFSSRQWSEYPLTAPKFAQWVSAVNGNGHIVNLFMDYETFGEHQWADTGIFEFLRALPGEILKHPDNAFVTPTEAARVFPAMGEIDVPRFVSWADIERDLSAWTANSMQQDALRKLYELEPLILKTKDAKLIQDWRHLQTSDHFYYMCTKWFADGDVHKYFNPYESPYDAFISFMNVLSDIQTRLGDKLKPRRARAVSHQRSLSTAKK